MTPSLGGGAGVGMTDPALRRHPGLGFRQDRRPAQGATRSGGGGGTGVGRPLRVDREGRDRGIVLPPPE